MLRLSRFPGQGIYIGRGVRVTVADYYQNGATLTVEATAGYAVSGPETSGVDHMMRQVEAERYARDGQPEDLRPIVVHVLSGEVCSIGRGITVSVISAEHEAEVQLGVEAPNHVAVSRDDFTLEDHMKWQERRESGGIQRRA